MILSHAEVLKVRRNVAHLIIHIKTLRRFKKVLKSRIKVELRFWNHRRHENIEKLIDRLIDYILKGLFGGLVRSIVESRKFVFRTRKRVPMAMNVVLVHVLGVLVIRFSISNHLSFLNRS